MVVDDDPIFRLLVGRVAQQLGRSADLQVCASLHQATPFMRSANFWVIDINLGDGVGPEWVKQKRDEGLVQPVLLLSHGPCQYDLEPLQPCHFLRKPSTLEDLRQLMQGWWSG
ncbi:hypothetical protein IV102_32750 [bacterium]|nr:hypothetical protein [bacterium]